MFHFLKWQDMLFIYLSYICNSKLNTLRFWRGLILKSLFFLHFIAQKIKQNNTEQIKL